MEAIPTLPELTTEQAALLEQARPAISRIFTNLWVRRGIAPYDVTIIVADIRSGLGLAYGRMKWPHDALARRMVKQVAKGRRPALVVPLWGNVRASFIAGLLPSEVGYVAMRPPGATVLLLVDRESHGALAFLAPVAPPWLPN